MVYFKPISKDAIGLRKSEKGFHGVKYKKATFIIQGCEMGEKAKTYSYYSYYYVYLLWCILGA